MLRVDNLFIAESILVLLSEEALSIPGMDGKLRRKKYIDKINVRLYYTYQKNLTQNLNLLNFTVI